MLGGIGATKRSAASPWTGPAAKVTAWLTEPSEAGDGGADAEGRHVDEGRVHAERLRHAGVLHHRAGDQPGAGELQRRADAGEDHARGEDQRDGVERDGMLPDRQPPGGVETPSSVLPKIMVTPPIVSSDRPEVASRRMRP